MAAGEFTKEFIIIEDSELESIRYSLEDAIRCNKRENTDVIINKVICDLINIHYSAVRIEKEKYLDIAGIS